MWSIQPGGTFLFRRVAGKFRTHATRICIRTATPGEGVRETRTRAKLFYRSARAPRLCGEARGVTLSSRVDTDNTLGVASRATLASPVRDKALIVTVPRYDRVFARVRIGPAK